MAPKTFPSLCQKLVFRKQTPRIVRIALVVLIQLALAPGLFAQASGTLISEDIVFPFDQVIPNERVRYTAQIVVEELTPDLQYVAQPPATASLVAGTVTTTFGTIVRGHLAAHTDVLVDLSGAAVSQSVTITYELRVALPLSEDVQFLFHQGQIRFGGSIPSALTDSEPQIPADQPNRVELTHAYTVLARLVDADSSGDDRATPGEVVRYTAEVEVRPGTGTILGTSARLDLSLLANLELVAGTVTTSVGAVEIGNGAGHQAISVRLEGLAAGSTAIVTFDARTLTSLPPSATHVHAQVRVTTRFDGVVPSDDPPTPTPRDPTSMLIGYVDLGIDKGDGGVTGDAGDLIVYRLDYRNTGNVEARGVTLVETVPANTRFAASSSSTGWSCDGSGPGSSCTLALGSVGAGAIGSRDFALRIDGIVPAGFEEILNAAAIADDGTQGPDRQPEDNGSSDTTPLGAGTAPDLAIAKTDDGFEAAPGQTIVYELQVLNQGTQGATGVTAIETVPAHTRFAAGSSSPGWSCADGAPAGTECRLELGALEGGSDSSGEILFAVILDLDVPDAVEEIVNTASAADDGANGADLDLADNQASETTPVLRRPDLEVTKSDADVEINPGETLVYDLRVRNLGEVQARDVLLTETVPAFTWFEASVSSAGWACSPDASAGSTCELALGTLAAGASESVAFAVVVDPALPAGVDGIENTVSVTDDGTSGPDPDPSNNTASETTPFGDGTGPDLDIEKRAEHAITNAGELLFYTISYRNLGNQGATGVELTEVIPTYTSFDPGSSDPDWNCAGGGNAGDVCTLAVGDVPAGESGSVSFVVRVDETLPTGVQSIANRVTIDGSDDDRPDLDPDNDSDDEDTPVGPDTAPDLGIFKSGIDDYAEPGQIVVYTLTYVNAGNQDATGVALAETVPANTTFAPEASSAGWACEGGGGPGETCTLSLGEVPAGANGSAEFAVRLDDPIPPSVGVIRNVATVADDGTNGDDLNPGNNRDEVTTEIDAFVDLEIVKRDGGLPATLGELFAYELTVSNLGDREATGVVITEIVPRHTRFDSGASSASWACAEGGGPGDVCTLDLGTVDLGTVPAVVDFVVRLDEQIPATLGCLVNTATVSDGGSVGGDVDLANNRATLWSAIANRVCEPTTGLDAAVAITDHGATAAPGVTVDYTIDYSNNGTQDVMGLVLTTTVPQHTRFAPATSDMDWQCTGDGGAGETCRIELGGLPPTAGGSRQIALFFEETIPYTIGDVALTVFLSDDGSQGQDADPTNNQATELTPVYFPEPELGVDLAIFKDDLVDRVTPGQILVYVLTYANLDEIDASGVAITETVPEHTRFHPEASAPGWSCGDLGQPGDTCTYVVGDVLAGESGEVEFAVLVDDQIPPGVGQILNGATIADDGTHGMEIDPSNNLATVATPIEGVTLHAIPTMGEVGLLALVLGLGAAAVRSLRAA